MSKRWLYGGFVEERRSGGGEVLRRGDGWGEEGLVDGSVEGRSGLGRWT